MQELLVYNQPAPCPYLPGQVSRLPLRRPLNITPRDFDRKLAVGDRRLGSYLYRTQCPACRACEAIRVPVADFVPVRTHRRMLKKGDELLSLRIGPPQCDDLRVDLYNRHKQARGLTHGEGPIDLEGYYEFLVDTCVETLEFSYWRDDQLVAVGVSDRGEKTLNAVYCYFEPSLKQISLGTYNVLKQIETCRDWGLNYLYLGYYIASSPRMSYKGSYRPHERLVGGVWTRFDRNDK